MAYGKQKLLKALRNPAKQRPMTKNEVVKIANAEYFQARFNPDYYQVLKRISDAPTGLRNGSPPPIVE